MSTADKQPDKRAAAGAGDPFYYRHRNLVVGIFVAIPIVLVPAICLFLLIKTEFWESYVTLHLTCQQGTGLSKDSPVYLLGTNAGHVDKVSINDRGYVDISLKLKRRYSHLIHKDSQAKIGQKNFVMDWQVEVTPGSDFYPPIADNDTLVATVPVSMEQIAERLVPMIEPIAQIFQSIANGEGLVRHILGKDTLDRQLSHLLDNGNNALGNTDKLFGGIDRTLGKANSMLDELQRFGEHGTATVDTFMVIGQKADDLIADLGELSNSLDSMATKLGPMPDDLSRSLKGLQKDLGEAEVLIRGAQEHWLLKRSIRKAKDKMAKEQLDTPNKSER